METLVHVINSSKQTLDAVMLEIGRLAAESVMLMEREACLRTTNKSALEL